MWPAPWGPALPVGRSSLGSSLHGSSHHGFSLGKLLGQVPDGFAGGEGQQVVEGVAEVELVAVLLHVAQVGHAEEVGQLQQRMADHRLFIIDVRGGHARAALPQGGLQGAGGDQLGAGGVHQQRGGLHAGQVLGGDDAAGLLVQPQVQAQHVAAREELRLAGGHRKARLDGPLARALAAPHQHLHLEGQGVAGHQLADLAVAEDAQGAPLEAGAQGALPAAGLEVGGLLGNMAHGGEHQPPGEFGGGVGRAGTGHHRDPPRLAGAHVHVGGPAAGLADRPEVGQPLQELGGDRGTLADQHQRLGVAEAFHQGVQIGDGVVVDRDVVALQPGEGVQVADAVLVVVGNHDLHHAGSFFSCAGGRQVFEYIELDYNRQRRHSTIGMVSQEAFEARMIAQAGVQHCWVRSARS